VRGTSRWVTSIQVAASSNPALATPGTALTSLVLTPALEVLLLVAVTASVGSTDLRDTAYAGIVLAFGLSVVTGTVEQVTLDRRLGVLPDVLSYGLRNPAYWGAKMLVPLVLGLAPAIVSTAGVLLVDPGHDLEAFRRVLLLLPVAALAGALVGLAASVASIGLSDPYLVSNSAHGLLLVTAGVVLPISLYPAWLGMPALALPFTAVVEAVRADGSTGLLVLRELAVCGAWCLVGLLSSRRVLAAVRSGRRSTEVW
jgi:ABC-2 type transport system permease protein